MFVNEKKTKQTKKAWIVIYVFIFNVHTLPKSHYVLSLSNQSLSWYVFHFISILSIDYVY